MDNLAVFFALVLPEAILKFICMGSTAISPLLILYISMLVSLNYMFSIIAYLGCWRWIKWLHYLQWQGPLMLSIVIHATSIISRILYLGFHLILMPLDHLLGA